MLFVGRVMFSYEYICGNGVYFVAVLFDSFVDIFHMYRFFIATDSDNSPLVIEMCFPRCHPD